MCCGTSQQMKDTQSYQIFADLDQLQTDYESKQIEIVDGLYFSQYKTIRMCEFYSNSTYIDNKYTPFGDKKVGRNKDPLGRDKPFYNIVNYRVALAKTATDLDIKDIQVVSDDSEHWVKAMFLNKEVYKWMKDANFSLTLNRMGYTRPKYGGYLVKKSEIDGKLKIDVVEWKNAYTSQVDILSGPIVEHHYMSPVDIKKKDGTWDNTTEVLKAHKKLKNGSSTIDVYEILGEFPVKTYKEIEGKEFTDADEYEFSLQKYFIAVVGEKKFKLYCEEQKGKEITDTYMYLSWEEMSGRGLGKGVIEDSEEAQVWTNDAVINEKNAMDLAGKVVLKTNSKKFANNILEVDNGKIFELGLNEDINSFNLVPAALGQFQSQIDKWKIQADNVTSSYDAVTGEQPPSGTPYSQTALLNQVATKPFDYRREEWGIHLTEMFEKWVLPYVIDNLYKGHTLRSDYSDDELKLIDESIQIKNGNAMKMSKILSPLSEDLSQNIPSPMDMQSMQMSVENELQKFGKTRFIEFPKGYFDDIEASVTIVTTGEQKNKAATLQSLSTILDTVIKSYNPNTGKFGVLEDPKLSKIFGTIVELNGAGLSPISLGLGGKPTPASTPQTPTPSPIQPQMQPQQSAPMTNLTQ